MLAMVTIDRKLADQREVKLMENSLKKVNHPQERNSDCPAPGQMFTLTAVKEIPSVRHSRI